MSEETQINPAPSLAAVAFKRESATETDIRIMSIEEISIYGGTQTRSNTNDDAIDSYAESIEGGQSFPPVEVYFDGAKYWLADGFHRLLAYKRAGKSQVQAHIFQGSRKDALLHALGANSRNSLYRSNADKRSAVEIALEEFPEEPNTFIAKICAVSPSMVRSARKRFDDLNNIESEESKSSKRDTKTKQVSVPAAGIERQARGGAGGAHDGNIGGNDGKSSNRKKSAEQEWSDMDLEDASEPEAAATIERSPFVYAANAIKCLSQIPRHDPNANAAYAKVADWLKIHSGERE